MTYDPDDFLGDVSPEELAETQRHWDRTMTDNQPEHPVMTQHRHGCAQTTRGAVCDCGMAEEQAIVTHWSRDINYDYLCSRLADAVGDADEATS